MVLLFALLMAAAPQEPAVGPVTYWACEISNSDGGNWRYIYPPVVATANDVSTITEQWREKAIAEGFPKDRTRVRCHDDEDRAYVESLRSGWIEQGRGDSSPMSTPDWVYDPTRQPAKAAAAPTAAPGIQRRTLFWSGNQGKREGFNNAQIDLAYAFLQCAGEIHIAYSLDRASFKASRTYYVPAKNFVAGKSGHDEMILDLDPPPAPPSIRLIGTVRYKAHPSRYIASIDDRFAGEALGMGCFDGQTRKLGTVAKLVGAGTTPDKVKSFLAELELETPMFVDGGEALKIAGAASTAVAQARAKAEAETLEARRQEEARLREANDAALKRAAEQRAAIDATLEKGREAQAAYAASMDRYRQEAAAAQAERQAYEARAAAHRACLAGDQVACQRYISGN